MWCGANNAKHALLLALALALATGLGRRSGGLNLVGETAVATGLAVLVHAHHVSGTAFWAGALASKSNDCVSINLVQFEDAHLGLGANTRDTLGLGVDLLLSLLTTTTKAKDKVEGRLLLDVVVRKGTAILKLLTSKDKALLIRGDAFLILNLALHLLNSITRLNIKGDSLTSKGLHENLHRTIGGGYV